jgi:hypothetical protein
VVVITPPLRLRPLGRVDPSPEFRGHRLARHPLLHGVDRRGQDHRRVDERVEVIGVDAALGTGVDKESLQPFGQLVRVVSELHQRGGQGGRIERREYTGRVHRFLPPRFGVMGQPPAVFAHRAGATLPRCSGMFSLKCPKCRSTSIRRSRRRRVDRFLSLVYVYPYRCEGCHQRFHALRWRTRYSR